ncbi:VP19 [Thermus phage P23-77]|uniref:VP19 n=1 Tax=Thermus virus P23-77 TaxID=1714272 RepID=C8CHL7_9VIRU|nr:VP19 [Thermus phage P23-77]ACV05046.1 VP19 [Thermus phage P23-77]
MGIVAGIAAGLGALGNLLDDFIFTDQERAQIEAQKQAAQAQVEAARLAQEKAMLEAASRARQAQALMVLGVTLGAAIVVAALVWRSA